MKKVIVILLIIVVIIMISKVASAKDIYAWTRETSQGAVFEYYVREEACIIKDKLLCADIITVRTDKWGKNTLPLIVEWQFRNFTGSHPYYSKVDKNTKVIIKEFPVNNDPMARKIFEIVKGVVFR